MNKFGKGRAKLPIAIIFLLLCLYVGTYVSMSVKGRYEPISIGLDHVHAWGWAPAGFMCRNGTWNIATPCNRMPQTQLPPARQIAPTLYHPKLYATQCDVMRHMQSTLGVPVYEPG